MFHKIRYFWLGTLLWIPILMGQAGCPEPTGITITAPEDGQETGTNKVVFLATFENVTDDPPDATILLGGVEIPGNGEVTIGEQTVLITGFRLSFAGLELTAWNLPIESLTFSVQIKQTRSAIEFSPQPDIGVYFGSGADGEKTISSANTVVNLYTDVTTSANAGATTLTVSNTSGFTNGDEILIIQMQDDGTNTGNFEIKQNISVTSNTISFETPLGSNFTSGTFNSTSALSTQVIRIPNFTDVVIANDASISATPWDGRIGGIVAFRVMGTVNTEGNGKIHANAAGYRGGPRTTGNYQKGKQGESTRGIGGDSRNANVGGGGAGNYDTCSVGYAGGGASYGTAGTKGTGYTGCGDLAGLPGAVYGSSDLAKIFAGSGGGGGATDQDDGGAQYGGKGGSGGGLIWIQAFQVDLPLIETNGSAGEAGSCPVQSETGGGGGGSGGAIYISGYNVVLDGGTATGGAGGEGSRGNNDGLKSNGGPGGKGRIRINYELLNTQTFPDPGEGENGISITNPPAFGGEFPPGN